MVTYFVAACMREMPTENRHLTTEEVIEELLKLIPKEKAQNVSFIASRSDVLQTVMKGDQASSTIETPRHSWNYPVNSAVDVVSDHEDHLEITDCAALLEQSNQIKTALRQNDELTECYLRKFDETGSQSSLGR